MVPDKTAWGAETARMLWAGGRQTSHQTKHQGPTSAETAQEGLLREKLAVHPEFQNSLGA